VSNLSSHIIKIERFTHLIFELARCRHRFKLEGHGGSRLDVPELKETCRHMSITIEKSPQLVLKLWEFFLTRVALVVLTIVIQHVNGLFVEQLADFGIGVNHFSQVGLLEVGVESLVAQPCVEHHQR